jgi:uncharacterized protein (TIGR02301 family)
MLVRTLIPLLVAGLLAAGPARAQQEAEQPETGAQGETAAEGEAAQDPASPPAEAPPVYDAQLLRLSEILGALHFLRGLCREGDAGDWRGEMESLLRAEAPGPTRQAQLVARFNYGFESYRAVYRSCTPHARRAIAIYLEKGGRIAADLRIRYGQ